LSQLQVTVTPEVFEAIVQLPGPQGPAGGGGGGGVSDGDKGDIVVSGSGTVWTFDTSVVTAFAKTLLDDASASAARTTLGATAAGSSMFTAADAAAQTALLNSFSSSLKGLAPASGGGTTNFLRADGTWAAPSGGTGTDLAYTASTRLLASSTGADVTLPLFTSTEAGLAPLSGGGTTNFLRADGTWAAPPGGGGVSDGDKGDITVSASGATWTVDNGAITYAKIQDVSATDRILGRSTAGAGDIEEIVCTAAARSLLDDANVTAMRTTLGVPPSATIITPGGGLTLNLSASALQLGSISSIEIGGFLTASAFTVNTDRLLGRSTALAGAIEEITCTAAGRALLDDADAAAQRTTLGAAASGAATASGLTMASDRLLGRTTASTGAVEEITAGASLSLTAGALNLADGDKGDITVSATGATFTIDANAVTYAKMQQAAANTVLCRAAGTTGNMAEVALAASRFLGRGSSGNVAAIAPGTGLSFSASSLDLASPLRFISGLTPATDRLPYFDSPSTAALATFTAAGRALVDDADATAQRTTLGLGALATQAAATATQVDYREAMRFGWDGGGSAPTVNSGAQAMAEHGLVVKAASIVATDANGDRVSDSLTVQFAKVSSGGTVTVLGSVSLSAAGYVRDTTLSGWTTSIAEGDSVRGKITSAGTTATRVSASLKCERV
jgi:hypothetical protein